MKDIDRTNTYEYFINILEKAPGHFYWKNKEGVYQGSNDAQAIFLGYKSGRVLIGKTDFDLPWKEQASFLRKIDKQVMETREEYSIEESVINSDGESFIFFSRKMPLYDPQTEKVIGVIGTSLDITKQKQAEQAKSAFIMNMAHDLRTPFTGIVGLAELQAMGTLKTFSEVVEFGKMIHSSGNQLLEILNAVIKTLDTEQFSHVIKKERFDLFNFAKEMQALIMPAIHTQQLKFVLRVEENVGLITTDKIRLKQILVNLLSNAVKFTPKGKITLSFKISTLNNLNDILIIKVIDTGIGIELMYHHRIFEKFEKIKPSYVSLNFTGCGIGLYLVKQLVADLKGKVTLQSELNKGSIFKIDIPLT